MVAHYCKVKLPLLPMNPKSSTVGLECIHHQRPGASRGPLGTLWPPLLPLSMSSAGHWQPLHLPLDLFPPSPFGSQGGNRGHLTCGHSGLSSTASPLPWCGTSPAASPAEGEGRALVSCVVGTRGSPGAPQFLVFVTREPSKSHRDRDGKDRSSESGLSAGDLFLGNQEMTPWADQG